MTESESTRLLSSSSSSSSTQSSTVSILSNWISGLSTNHLPTNPQLYLALHKSAGIFDGLSKANFKNPTDQFNSSLNEEEDQIRTDPNVATRLLEEFGPLFRDLARWITVDDKVQQEEAQGPSKRNEIKSPPKGNSTNQIQRLLFYGRKSLVELEKELMNEITSKSDLRVGFDSDLDFEGIKNEVGRKVGEEFIPNWEGKVKAVKDEVGKAKEEVTQNVKVVKEDTKNASSSISSLSEIFIAAATPEIQLLILDLILLLRETLADKAEQIGDKVGKVEEEVRPSESEMNSDQPLIDLGSTTKEVLSTAFTSEKDRESKDLRERLEKVKGKGKEKERDEEKSGEKDQVKKEDQKENYDREKEGDTEADESKSEDEDEKQNVWIEETAERLGKVLKTAQSSPSYSPALNTLIDIGERYANYLKGLEEKVEGVLDDGKQRVEKVTEVLEGKREVEIVDHEGDGESLIPDPKIELSSDKKDSQSQSKMGPQSPLSENLTETFKAARELLEGLAGGKSLEPIEEQMLVVWEGFIKTQDEEKDLDEEAESFEKWFTDLKSFLQEPEKFQEASSSSSSEPDKFQVSLRDLLKRFYSLIKSHPTHTENFKHLLRLCDEHWVAIKDEPLISRIGRRISRIGNEITGAFDVIDFEGGIKGLIGLGGKSAKAGLRGVKELFWAVLPGVLEVVKVLPLPRVEFVSDDLEAVVDDLSIPTIQLIPSSVHISTQLDLDYQRGQAYSTHLSSSHKVQMKGFKLKLKDVSFYISEHFTAPKPTTCRGCCSCSCLPSVSENSIFNNFWTGGPSNWLSYTESGFLDSGFGGEGIGIDIEVKDAEDNEDEGKYKDNPEPEDDDQDIKEREHFFVVENVKVDVSQSFDFKIRNSRHWIINSLIRTTSKPIIKLVMERVFASLVEDGLVKLDKSAYDLYSRAKYLRNHRHHHQPKKGEQLLKPRFLDFLVVFFSSEKGKSEKRLRREQEEKEEKEKKDEEEKKKKEEELREVRENQPKGMKEMQIKPAGVIKTDPSGSYSIAVGVKPILLPYENSGPPTLATELRKDVTEGDFKRLGKRSTAGIRRAVKEAQVPEKFGKVGGTIKDGVRGVVEVRERVGELREDEGNAEETWKSKLFDL